MYGQRIFTRNNFCMFFSIWQDIAGRGGVGGGYRCGRDDFVCLHPLSISPVLQVWTRNYFFFSIWLPLKKGAKCSIGAHCVLGLTRPMVGWTAPLLVPPRPSLVKLQVKMFPTWGNVTPPHWCVTPPWEMSPPSDLSPPWISPQPPLTCHPPMDLHGCHPPWLGYIEKHPPPWRCTAMAASKYLGLCGQNSGLCSVLPSLRMYG